MVRRLGSARAIRLLPGAIPAVAAGRALRAAVVVPVTFMFGDLVLHDANVWLFAALGSVTMLLFVELDGSMRDRLRAHVAFVAATSPLVLAGTAVSRTVWPAAVVALLLSFVILFSGIISSVLAGATAGLLISFLLPATVPGTMSVAPDRLVGWLIAGAASLAAVAFVWPSPTADPLGASAGSACRELAVGLRPASRGMFAPVSTEPATAAVDALGRAFFNAPYRPAGLSVGTRMLLQAVQQILSLATVLDHLPPDRTSDISDTPARRALKTAARVLTQSGEVVTSRLSREVAGRGGGAVQGLEAHATLNAAFRAHEVATVTAAIATYAQSVVAAQNRSWRARLLGHAPGRDGLDHFQAVRRLQDDLLPAAARAASTSNSTAPPRGGGRTFSLHSKTARRLARRRGASYDHM